MTETKFALGTSPAATVLIALLLLGAGAYFGHAGWANLTESIFVDGRQMVGREGVRLGMYGIAALMGGAGLMLALRGLRNRGREKFVALGANHVVISGFDLSGEERVIAYGEIVRMLEYRVRGMPVIEIEPRQGEKVMFASVLFRGTVAFDQFRRELRLRLPPGVAQ